MFLKIDKGQVSEVEKISKDKITYQGFLNDGEEIKIEDIDKDSIIPVVRFLAEGSGKKGLPWWFWLLSILFVIIAIVSAMAIFGGGEQKIVEKAKVVIEQTDQEKELEKERDLRGQAESEVMRLIEEIETLKNTIPEKEEIVKEVVCEPEIIEIEKECKKDYTGFIYELGVIAEKNCKKEENKDKCAKLYYNYITNE